MNYALTLLGPLLLLVGSAPVCEQVTAPANHASVYVMLRYSGWQSPITTQHMGWVAEEVPHGVGRRFTRSGSCFVSHVPANTAFVKLRATAFLFQPKDVEVSVAAHGDPTKPFPITMFVAYGKELPDGYEQGGAALIRTAADTTKGALLRDVEDAVSQMKPAEATEYLEAFAERAGVRASYLAFYLDRAIEPERAAWVSKTHPASDWLKTQASGIRLERQRIEMEQDLESLSPAVQDAAQRVLRDGSTGFALPEKADKHAWQELQRSVLQSDLSQGLPPAAVREAIKQLQTSSPQESP